MPSMLTRRTYAVVASLLLGAATLTACGGTSDADAGSDGGTRTVSTPEGEVEVPVDPQRIVTTHGIATQPLVDLGVEPIGAGEMRQWELYPDYWQQVKDIPTVANANGAEIEKIAEMNPDLIFDINVADEGQIEQLEKIAPVVLVPIDGEHRSDWQGRAEMIADVVGKQGEVKKLADEYAQRAKEIKSTYSDVLQQNTISIIDSYAPGEIYPSSDKSMVGNILSPAGATWSDGAKSEDVRAFATQSAATMQPASFEKLAAFADGDVVFYGAQASNNEPTGPVKQMLNDPIMNQTSAAKNDQLFPIGKTTIAGYSDAFGTLDLFEKALEELQQR